MQLFWVSWQFWALLSAWFATLTALVAEVGIERIMLSSPRWCAPAWR